MITVVYAHPYPSRSRACAAMLSAIDGMAGVAVRSLYDLYPDYDIDAAAEREALERSDAIVWLHPVYWYTVPSLMKHWFDHVLVKGWAYGEGGAKLAGKPCLWVATTGADFEAYSADGLHAHPFEAFAPVVEQTARFCGMRWQAPLIVHGAHHVADSVLLQAGEQLRARLAALAPVKAVA